MRTPPSIVSVSVRLALAWLLLLPAPPLDADEVTTLSPIRDTTLDQGAPTTNSGTATNLVTRTAASKNNRTLVEFSLPAGLIKSSTLRMVLAIPPPLFSRSQAVHRLTSSWSETQATWNQRVTGTNWSTAGGSFEASAAATASTGTTAGATISWTIAGDPGSFGLLVKDATEDGAPLEWWDANWIRRRKLIFNNSAQAENLDNFPILVVLNSVRINYAETKAGGADLRFVDDDGTTVLAHEIERWSSGGTSYVWVKVPRINASSSSDFIWMYYGNSGASDGQNKTAVWSNGYDRVWHFENNSMTDSVGNNNATNSSSTNNASAKIAGGRSFNGSSQFIDSNFTKTYSGTANFSYEVWWFGDSTVSNTDCAVGTQPGTQELRIAVRNASGNDFAQNFVRDDSGSSSWLDYDPETSVLNGWHYAVVTRNGSNDDLFFYFDGVERASNLNAAGGTITYSLSIYIGANHRSTGAFDYLDGSVDEVRISNVVRSAAWISAQYKSMTDTFLNYSDEMVAAPRYYSREDAVSANRPQLEVHYLRDVTLGAFTPGISEVTLNWTFPTGSTSSNYDGVLFAKKQGGSAPTLAAADGTSYSIGQEPVAGETVVANTSGFATVSVVDENGPDSVVVPGTLYTYKGFTRDNNTITGAVVESAPHFAPGVSASTTTTTGGGSSKNWSYKTAATTLAAPGLVAGGTVVAGGNDNKVHAMNSASGARQYRPTGATGTTGGAVQSRTPVIPANKTSHSCACDVVYVGAGDGKVYAFNASTGAKLWESAVLGSAIQGAPAVQVKAFSNASYPHAFDLVIVGTRNSGMGSTTNNKIVALNGNDGTTVWTYNPGNLDTINSAPMVDYGNNLVWVSSRAGAAGSQASLWKLDTTTLNAAGNSLGSITLTSLPTTARHIDTSATLNSDGTFLYALTTNSDLVAVEVATNNVYETGVSSNNGVGFPIPIANGASDDVYFSSSGGVRKRIFNRTTKSFSVGWNNTGITNPSTPILSFGGSLYLYVGASDGKLHKLDPSDGTDLAQRTVNVSATIGDPSFDTISSKLYVGASDGRIYSFDLF